MMRQSTVATAAFAQTPAAQPQATTTAVPALTAEQQAQLQKQNDQMARAALQVAQMIDQNKAGEVWDGASSVTRQIVKRADFVKQTDSDRKTLGTVGERKLANITRTESKGDKLPPGIYVNVSFMTRFAKARQPVRELISFHLDDDRVWRVSGYTVR